MTVPAAIFINYKTCWTAPFISDIYSEFYKTTTRALDAGTPSIITPMITCDDGLERSCY